MNTGPDGIRLMHYFEGCRLTAYPDPATGGDPWTIGWGETGPHVRPGMTITQDEADDMFVKRLALEFEPGVSASLRSSTNQKQFDALVAFAFNLGLGNLRSSTLLRLHNAGDYEAADDEFIRWNKAAGRIMKGLSRRRWAERGVYSGMDADDAIQIALSMYP
jgi:lysozyme